MTTAALIVAAGRGLRAGGGVPKQWRALAGARVIDHTLRAFDATPLVAHIVMVLHADDMDRAAELRARGYLVALGAPERSGSVRAGLEALAPLHPQKVLIHDAARPCITPALIGAVIEALQTNPAAAPALALSDALWSGADGQVTGTRDRSNIFRAQTPQGFDFAAIRAAHSAHMAEAADDVEVARAAGIPVAIVPGDADNLKITQAGDFERAARILKGRQMSVRLGNGFDVHRFGPGDHVMLCGVAVPHERGLQGHSDADVGMHAVTDAIYGALAQGDIGRHFPPSDPQWKGAASEIFLRHAAGLAEASGWKISNVDCTLICERPKIGPHAEAMQAALSAIMGLSPGAVSVKATTTEKLGFAGRGEGIAAQAPASVSL